MKLIIAGGRDFDDLQLALKSYFELCTEITLKTGIPEPFTEIVSGGAKGADSIAAMYADERHIKLTIFRPLWNGPNGYNPRAAFERNELIVKRANLVLAFWDGYSGGTRDSINKACKWGIPVLVYKP